MKFYLLLWYSKADLTSDFASAKHNFQTQNIYKCLHLIAMVKLLKIIL